MPSHLSSNRFLPVNIEANNSKLARITATMSLLFPVWKGNGFMIEPIPRTKKILKIFEPTTLPTAISTFLLWAATAEVASSGSDVPTATMVNPTKDWLIPNFGARCTAPSTIHFPPTFFKCHHGKYPFDPSTRSWSHALSAHLGVSFALSNAGGVIPQIYIGNRTRWSQGVRSPGKSGRSGRLNLTSRVFPSR